MPKLISNIETDNQTNTEIHEIITALVDGSPREIKECLERFFGGYEKPYNLKTPKQNRDEEGKDEVYSFGSSYEDWIKRETIRRQAFFVASGAERVRSVVWSDHENSVKIIFENYKDGKIKENKVEESLNILMLQNLLKDRLLLQYARAKEDYAFATKMLTFMQDIIQTDKNLSTGNQDVLRTYLQDFENLVAEPLAKNNSDEIFPECLKLFRQMLKANDQASREVLDDVLKKLLDKSVTSLNKEHPEISKDDISVFLKAKILSFMSFEERKKLLTLDDKEVFNGLNFFNKDVFELAYAINASCKEYNLDNTKKELEKMDLKDLEEQKKIYLPRPPELDKLMSEQTEQNDDVKFEQQLFNFARYRELYLFIDDLIRKKQSEALSSSARVIVDAVKKP